ncbi:unnamed protein product, partial [Medioppia subpectinata]
MGYAIRRHPKAYLGGRIGEAIISLVTFSMTFGICWWNKDFMHFSYRYTRLNGYEQHLYLLIHKVFYLSGFCWLFYACATGRAEIINKIMGWKGFNVINNLALEIYILHIYRVLSPTL